ncbi:DUF6396 domain-containing protein [Burkholderia sp. AU38729]|nr:DUF6396 domain-containing protein [Burkholderia sp. AU38729]MCA8066412.1 DUF6396 domain-containing protein [Burkholderia sp. AU38729]
MNRHLWVVVLAVLSCACTKREPLATSLPDTSAVRANLVFTCMHQADTLPPLDPQADSLFRYANDRRHPLVPDIDRIVPLPPAKLPPWDGTFQWKKDQHAATPPLKPSDELINKMAKARHLDLATGLPLSGSADKAS